MSIDYAREYLDFIQSHCRALLSINHEANDFTVAEVAKAFRRIRHLYPMREGYVEELYIPQTSKGVFVER